MFSKVQGSARKVIDTVPTPSLELRGRGQWFSQAPPGVQPPPRRVATAAGGRSSHGSEPRLSLKDELNALVEDAMREHLEKLGISAQPPQSPAEVRSVLLDACTARLHEMDKIGAARKMPEMRDSLERFITALEEESEPAFKHSPSRMIRPSDHCGFDAYPCNSFPSHTPGLVEQASGARIRRTGGGWDLPPENISKGPDMPTLLQTAEQWSSFMHNPSACLKEEKDRSFIARKNLSFCVDGMEVGRQLESTAKHRPYLASPEHPLNHWVQRCRESLQSGNVANAQDSFDRLEAALHTDEERLRAAFAKFDQTRSGELGLAEFRPFACYVGFGIDAVDELIRLGNCDSNGSVSLAEICDLVGHMGGVHSLLEQRRWKLATTGDKPAFQPGSRVRACFQTKRGTVSQNVWDGRVLSVTKDGQKALVRYDMGKYHFSQEVPLQWIDQDVDVMAVLGEIGILDDAQHYWTMIVSASERQVLKLLSSCQRTAIDHVRTMATVNHRKALPELMSRASSLGINDECLSAMLSWIRDGAAIIVPVRLEEVGPSLDGDTHYRNHFEKKSSSGNSCADTPRTVWERARLIDLFGVSYINSTSCERPKHAMLDVMNDHRGIVGNQYVVVDNQLALATVRDSYLVLKDVRLRCTLSSEEVGSTFGSQLAVLDQYAHILLEYKDHELQEVARIASAPSGSVERLGDSLRLGEHKEAHIHGDIDLKKHVQRLVVNERHHTAHAAFGEAAVRSLCRRHGWELVWMDDERARRLTEDRTGVETKGFEVNWCRGEVVACTEEPDILSGGNGPSLDVTLDLPRSAASPVSRGRQRSRAGASPGSRFAASSGPVSDLCGRAVKNGLGSLSKEERDMLHAQWAHAATWSC